MVSISREVEDVGGQSSNHTDGCSERSVEKATVRNRKSTDIKDVVELSIAASEVKQARLESSECAFDCPTETSDEMDFLSESDDFTMADAFEDVRFSFNCFSTLHACGSDVSLVKETPVSGDCFGSGNRTENAEKISPQNKHSYDPTSSLKSSDPILLEMVQDSSHRVGFSMEDASFPSQADLNCLDLCPIFPSILSSAGEDSASPFVTDEFRSRWFGGWTGEEADTEQPKPKNKYITKCFAAETSFFSESADVAPDENSLVRKCENKRSNIASDRSVHFEGLPRRVDEGFMFPKIISSENTGTTSGQNKNYGEGSAGNCPDSVGLRNENMHVESIFETRQALSEFDGAYSAAKVLRQATSLKTYNLRDRSSGIRSCDKRDSEMYLALCSIPECTSGQDAEETIAVNNPDGEGMNDKNYEYAKDTTEVQDQPSMGKSSLLVLRQRMSQRLQATKLLDCDLKANAEQAIAEDVLVFRNSDNNRQGMQAECHNASASRPSKRVKSDAQIRDGQKSSTLHLRNQKSLLFQDIKFLLTGFSRGQEKEIEGLIWKYGGTVLVDIPSPSNRGEKMFKEEVSAASYHSMPKEDKWLADSIAAGSALSPAKYMVQLHQPETTPIRIRKPVRHDNSAYIFNGIGVMLHGKPHFCTKIAKVIQHGGGRVFGTLLWLIQNLDSEKISLAVIFSEGENRASRHLRQCALERKIPTVPSSWIVRSLYSGKLLPFTEKKLTTLHAVVSPDLPGPKLITGLEKHFAARVSS
ncbi:Detected protein of unknown function [Hibiscus syriacus]|uniref:BRCT domain-containing protein n=1 Tax=Hibiscus syriacus TaxID=106335 RepID=A0A6A2YF49_HIBSY|nr:Detected protein of unknown function [Hibiscus syriacus]